MKTVHDIPDAPYTDSPLGLMFYHQKNLMAEYKKLNRLPQFPFTNLDDLDNQNFLRELMGFFDEEVREAYAELQLATTMLETDAEGDIITVIEKFNEELADVTHFLMEIMVYVNIDEHDVDAYYQKILTKDNGLDYMYFKGNPLKTSFEVAAFENRHAGLKDRTITMVQHHVMSYKLFAQAGSRLSNVTLPHHQQLLFLAGLNMSKARNLLKNKYWKESTTQTNVGLFQENIMNAWSTWIGYLEFVGSNVEHTYQTYFKKNQVNQDRIINKW